MYEPELIGLDTAQVAPSSTGSGWSSGRLHVVANAFEHRRVISRAIGRAAPGVFFFMSVTSMCQSLTGHPASLGSKDPIALRKFVRTNNSVSQGQATSEIELGAQRPAQLATLPCRVTHSQLHARE